MTNHLATDATKRDDYSGVAILLSNAFTIGLALVENWDLRPLLIIYWSQSVLIGLFNFWRIIKLKSFSTEGFTSNGKPVPESAQGKWSTAVFFAVHYGIFHFGYASFIFAAAFGGDLDAKFGGAWQPDQFEWLWVSAAIAAFLCGHWFSFRTNVAADLAGRPNLGTMMFLPYARIIPMHLTIIFGFGFGSGRFALLLFLVLKSCADWVMHKAEHRILQKDRSASIDTVTKNL